MNINDLLETNLYDNTQTNIHQNPHNKYSADQHSGTGPHQTPGYMTYDPDNYLTESDTSDEQNNLINSDYLSNPNQSDQSDSDDYEIENNTNTHTNTYTDQLIFQSNSKYNSKYNIESLNKSILPLITNTDKNAHTNYTRQIISSINIDSRARNIIDYPNSCYYKYIFNREYNNIYSISLENIKFKDLYPSINKYNNNISWTTYYSYDDYYTYECILNTGDYTVSNLKNNFETNCNKIKHSIITNSVYYPLFRFNYNEQTKAIQIIQRINEYRILSIKTTVNTNIIEITFENPYNVAIPYPFNNNPIIITGLSNYFDNYANIPVFYLDYCPFYPQSNIPVNQYNYYTTYFSSTSIFTYALSIYDNMGEPVYASHSYNNISLDNPTPPNSLAYIGEVLPFSFSIPSFTTLSFIEYIGITDSNQPKLIHTNLTNTQILAGVPSYNNSCGLWLENTDYVLMRIETENKPNGTISDNLYNNLIYYDSTAGQTHNESNYYFAKIYYNDLLNGSISFGAGNKLFYDFYLDKLTNLMISFYDSRGNLINGQYNHNFTIQIIELQTTLNNTLIDSRTGGITNAANTIKPYIHI